ncbi:hypothetical protein [Massilia sp. Root335]|jgi:hypothetical protein|uniref:hypothetical protein n=1 Tax=Massilia sp. Root335 TaxID=1736517 RepID=UPI0006F92F61|nr:hypothetical protein [Massilia sp. Root335]KQV42854.1 hypothetical protein ASC93_16100 [Massilia sp. Root335]
MMFPTRPYERDQLDYYYRGFVSAYLADLYSPAAGDIPDEYLEPYRVGVEDGQRFAIDGIPLDEPCVDLGMEETDAFAAGEAIHYGAAAIETKDALLAGTGLLRVLLRFSFIATALMVITHTRDYRWVDESVSTDDLYALQDLLAQAEDPVLVDLYIGGGVDYNVDACQMQCTNIYKNEEDVRAALVRMGRATWIIGKIQSNMSGGLEIIERNGP